MGIVAVLLVLGRELIYTTSRGQNVLPFANLPLFAVLHIFCPGIIYPIPAGRPFTNAQAIWMHLPYYLLFVLTYVGYGLLIDLIIRKLKKPKAIA